MIATVDWNDATLTAAFILGAILATLATLRIVRAVASMFAGQIHRDPTKEQPDDHPRRDQ